MYGLLVDLRTVSRSCDFFSAVSVEQFVYVECVPAFQKMYINIFGKLVACQTAPFDAVQYNLLCLILYFATITYLHLSKLQHIIIFLKTLRPDDFSCGYYGSRNNHCFPFQKSLADQNSL